MPKLFCTVLGCGTSAGVPSLGMGWGACDESNPKNRRMRCSLLLQWREGDKLEPTNYPANYPANYNELENEQENNEQENNEQENNEQENNEKGMLRSVLIDSSPDCREQLMRARLKRLDSILYTHDHADHCHGIDDLKWMRGEEPLTAYATRTTITSLTRRFGYIFNPQKTKSNLSLYRPVLKGRAITPFRSFCPIADASESASNKEPQILPIALEHGFSTSVLGFRIGDFAYTTDCVELSERAFEALAGVRWWVVGCLRREEHPTHAHLARVISWVDRLGAEMTYLTHMNGSMDYASLCAELPKHIRPAYDFLRIQAEFQ